MSVFEVYPQDLSHRSEGYASCISVDQPMTLSCGARMTTGEIARRLDAGHELGFRTPWPSGYGKCRNPITGFVRTAGQGVRITFADWRSVQLTTGHMLPVERWEIEATDPDLVHLRISGQPDAIWQEEIVRAGDVRAGDVLADGRVMSVTPVGHIQSIRLWTAHPAWIPTSDGLMVGTRLHELVHAWGEGVYVDTEYGPEVDWTTLGGYLWARPERGQFSGSAHDPGGTTVVVPEVISGRASEDPAYVHNLGHVRVILDTLRERGSSCWGGMHHQHYGAEAEAEEAQVEGLTGTLAEFAPQLEAITPAATLRLQALCEGPEVIEPARLFCGRVAVAA